MFKIKGSWFGIGIELVGSIGFPLIGMLMLWFGFSGKIPFGEYGSAEYFMGLRIWIIIAIFFFVTSQLFIGKNWKRRIVATVVTFIGILLMLFITGSYFGLMNVTSGTPDAFNPPMSAYSFLFAVSTSAYADLTVGLNMKLVSDSICYMVPTFVFLVLIVQMLYAGEADEFIKAFIEGVMVIIFILLYSLVGGVPVYL